MTRALLLIAGLSLCAPGPAWAEDPMPVTSDTAVYCLDLAQRMDEAGAMPPQMRVLWEKGRDLCTHGHIRGGLMRLRRAMMISRGVAE